MWDTSAYVAGVRLSVIVSSPALRFLFSTLTTIRTGLRSPTRTSSDNASVIVALKSPVRRCLGRCCRIFVIDPRKPRSRSLKIAYVPARVDSLECSSYLSASSRTKISSSLTLTRAAPRPRRNSSMRPGVPITISADVSKNL
jgi:hypothetical protein